MGEYNFYNKNELFYNIIYNKVYYRIIKYE